MLLAHADQALMHRIENQIPEACAGYVGKLPDSAAVQQVDLLVGIVNECQCIGLHGIRTAAVFVYAAARAVGCR